MKYHIDADAGSRLIRALSGDAAFCRWARSLDTLVCFQCGAERISVAIKDGQASLSRSTVAQVCLFGNEDEWTRALETGYRQGFYDVVEAPDKLHLSADPYLIASNAKAFTRLWKQFRSAVCGEERAWDWNV